MLFVLKYHLQLKHNYKESYGQKTANFQLKNQALFSDFQRYLENRSKLRAPHPRFFLCFFVPHLMKFSVWNYLEDLGVKRCSEGKNNHCICGSILRAFVGLDKNRPTNAQFLSQQTHKCRKIHRPRNACICGSTFFIIYSKSAFVGLQICICWSIF